MKTSIITCPLCASTQEEQIPTDACVFFYTCKSCGRVIKPKEGDCCVFCSYGSAACGLPKAKDISI